MFKTKKGIAALLAAIAALSILATSTVQAQDPPPPPTRVIAVTSFEAPYGEERVKLMSFLEEYFFPGFQLHPKVKNFRMMGHNWGSIGDEVVMLAEYEEFADIEAECGQPCDDYFAQHAEPEEGDDGYEEYQEKLAIFNKYYAKHRDEIYSTNMNRAVVEGRMQGTVGPTPQSEM